MAVRRKGGTWREVPGRSDEKYPDWLPEMHVPRVFCQVRPFWEKVRRRVRAGGQLFPALTGPGFADKLRAASCYPRGSGTLREGESRPPRNTQRQDGGD